MTGDSKGTVLVTGASRGIGYELARVFAATGHDVVLVARTESDLREAANYFEDRFGADTWVITADLSDPSAPRELYDACEDRGIAVDVLVNNAGFGTSGPFVESDLDAELDEIQVNLAAPTALTRLFLPDLVDRGGGVLNVASSAAFAPGPMMAVYYATKAYLVSFTEALAEEHRGDDLTVTALCPGPVDTDFQEVAGNEDIDLYRSEMDARTVARAGYKGYVEGEVVVIPGLAMKAGYVLGRIAPRALTRRVVRWLNTP